MTPKVSSLPLKKNGKIKQIRSAILQKNSDKSNHKLYGDNENRAESEYRLDAEIKKTDILNA